MVLWVTVQFIQYPGFLMAKTELVVLQGQAGHQELAVAQEFQEAKVMMVQIVEDGHLE